MLTFATGILLFNYSSIEDIQLGKKSLPIVEILYFA